MERKKIGKKQIIRWTCCILAVLLVSGMFYQYWYKPRHGYQPQPHTNEELLLLSDSALRRTIGHGRISPLILCAFGYPTANRQRRTAF